MILTIDELVKVLRNSVNVQMEEAGDEATNIDPVYISMSDDDLILFIKLAVSRVYPNITNLADLPEGSEYPISLLAKIELFTKLAVTNADDVDMGADSNNYLKNDQRFQHYMGLVKNANDQYNVWLENEGQGEVNSYDVLIDRNHYSRRNYEKQPVPKVTITVDAITCDSVEFHWKVTDSSHFGRFKVYISKTPVIDMFQKGAFLADKVSEDATLVLSTRNFRNTSKRVLNLESSTQYYIAVASVERNQVWGYAETTFNTPPEFVDDEEDIDISEFPEEGR